jgi:hypothetical protein
MPKFPRNVKQNQAVRAFVRLGGREVPYQGKGSHRAVLMPNGYTAIIPYGTLPVGLLAAVVKAGNVSAEEFIEAL